MPKTSQLRDFSDAAVAAARQALHAGAGKSAQFDHPELGGPGQWMPGMIMIGQMSNHGLRARVAALFESLLDDAETGRSSAAAEPSMQYERSTQGDRWYPPNLGVPASTGEQGELRYAYFPAAARLAVWLRGRTSLYDTEGHAITGVSQAQTERDGTITFTSQRGTVRLADLKQVQ